MAEHGEKSFEHDFENRLRAFDENIKIPEIPDVQNIFDKAEEEKTNVVPFKKYSRYIAAAAAVVLICVSVPFISSAASAEFAPQEPMAMADRFVTEDNSITEDADTPAEAEMFEPESAEEPVTEMPENEEDYDGIADEINQSIDYSYVLTTALEEFFRTNSAIDKGELKDQSSAASSSSVNPETGGSGTNPELGGVGDSERNLKVEYDDNGEISLLSEKINKKRSIEIVVEEESVSVMLFDTSAGDEVISAFWVEGTYESTYPGKEIYTICLSKKITMEDFEEGYYLPMAGDPINGTYFISAEDITVANTVKKGELFIFVEIDLKNGDYKIKANLR